MKMQPEHRLLEIGMKVEVTRPPRSSLKRNRDDEEEDDKVLKKSGEKPRHYPRSHSVPSLPTKEKDIEKHRAMSFPPLEFHNLLPP